MADLKDSTTMAMNGMKPMIPVSAAALTKELWASSLPQITASVT
jgi:hypothetical protein